ncbi:MAG: hypothetical protein ACTTI6_05675 [Treponema sp.]|uniref:hypothetical protein n=1 Tax=Treponema sp. TaxID=166 RepID=UPI003FA2DC7B
MGSENITLRIMKTANGWYVEHEASDATNSYAVEGDAWEALNPALAGTFETPFKAPEENESGAQKPKISELKAKIKTLEAAEKELDDLKEAAGGIDILQAIESAKKAQAHTNP